MPYADRLHKCSIARIPVVHRSSSKVAGRPHAVHLSATKDYAEFEPLPLHGEDFTEEVEVIGRDFDLTMQEIEEVLAKKESFQYIHPIWGPLDVVLRSPARFVDRPNGVVNKCSITLELRRAAIVTPKAPEFTPTAVARQIAGAQSSIDEGLKPYPDELGFADLIQAFVGKIVEAADFIGGINGQIASKLGLVNSMTAAVKELERNANTLVHSPQLLRSSLGALVLSGANLLKTASAGEPALSPSRILREQHQRKLERLGTGIASGERQPLRPSDATTAVLSGLLSVRKWSLDVSDIPTGPDQTPQRAAQLAQTKALERWTRASLVVQLAGSLVDGPWESAPQVRRAAQVVRDELEFIRNEPGHSPSTIRALRGVMLSLAGFFDSQLESLPRVRIVEVKRARSLVLLAHDLFGDANLHTRLAARNREVIRDPGRMPVGTELEVLGD